eukprot:4121131-Amphidinium_carterae.1
MELSLFISMLCTVGNIGQSSNIVGLVGASGSLRVCWFKLESALRVPCRYDLFYHNVLKHPLLHAWTLLAEDSLRHLCSHGATLVVIPVNRNYTTQRLSKALKEFTPGRWKCRGENRTESDAILVIPSDSGKRDSVRSAS